MRATIRARLTLFGSASTDATLEATPRPRRVRLARSLLSGAAVVIVAPLAALIPPHVPWALAVLAVGGWRARAEWRGEFRLHAFEGSCPRCGAALDLRERYVTPPVVVPCYGCHAQPLLVLLP